ETAANSEGKRRRGAAADPRLAPMSNRHVQRGKRLTIQEERAQLDEVRKLRPSSLEEHERWLKQRYGIARFDQFKAAAAETRANVRALAGIPPYLNELETVSLPLTLIVHAGVLRCFAQHSC